MFQVDSKVVKKYLLTSEKWSSLALQWLFKTSSRGSREIWLELSQRNQIQFKPLDCPFIAIYWNWFPREWELLFSELHKKMCTFTSKKILFSKSTGGSSGCSALYLILYSRNVLNFLQKFCIHGVWVFCDTALGEYWFCSTLHKVALVRYGEEKPWIKAAVRKFSHAAHVCGLVQIMGMLYLLD